MTFETDCSISRAKVELERVPVYMYVENSCLNCCYFGISIQSSVAQLVTHRMVILEAER